MKTKRKGTVRPPVWIKADGTTEVVYPAAKTWSLEEMQAKVGGFIEIVGRNNLADGYVMIVNEEGRLTGLPENQKASIMAGQPIVGDVLVTARELVK
jgi:hypothetical protein